LVVKYHYLTCNVLVTDLTWKLVDNSVNKIDNYNLFNCLMKVSFKVSK